jgi:hypothetical protein
VITCLEFKRTKLEMTIVLARALKCIYILTRKKKSFPDMLTINGLRSLAFQYPSIIGFLHILISIYKTVTNQYNMGESSFLLKWSITINVYAC